MRVVRLRRLAPGGDRLILVAHHGAIPQTGSESFLPLVRGTVGGRSVLDGWTVHIADIQTEGDKFPNTSENARRQGYRTILSVPLMREGVAIGAIVLRRTETRLFNERQIALLQTFADQAVIAIENVRLFEKEQQRTHELTEALEQQTATADLLKVISRSTFDLQTVFTALAESATRLCQADAAFIWRLDGTSFHLAATSEIHEEFNKFAIEHPPSLNRTTASGRCVLERRAVHISDVREDPEYDWGEGQKIGVFRTMLGVPLLRREGAPLGAFVLWRRIVRPFTDKQIELVTTFADQAVIAIENTRLLNELRESLEQQTATADVLKMISSSPGELAPVFEAMLANATRICEAKFGSLVLFEGNTYRRAALYNAPAAFVEGSDRSRRPVRYGNAHHNCSRHRPVGLWPNCS